MSSLSALRAFLCLADDPFRFNGMHTAQPKRLHVGGLDRVDHLFSAAHRELLRPPASSVVEPRKALLQSKKGSLSLEVLLSRGADEQTSRRADEQTSQEGLERKCDSNNNKRFPAAAAV